VVVFGSDFLAPVARRWKGQINEIAKAWAQFEPLPEADHNTLAGLNHPDETLNHIIAIFLDAPENHPRSRLRTDFTRQIFMTQGINTDTIQAKGEGRMAQIWTALHFGDYTAYYLAMAYREDPGPVEALVVLKEALNHISTGKEPGK
jgi:glucose/mannose-6-phosphate isomerase